LLILKIKQLISLGGFHIKNMKKALLIIILILLILIFLALVGIIRFMWTNEDTVEEYTAFVETCRFVGIAFNAENRVVPILGIQMICMNI